MPIDPKTYPAKSGLVNELLEGQLSQLFGKLAAPVEIICILGSDDKSAEMAALLNHVCGLSDKLALKLLAPGEDAALEVALDAELLPATAVGSTRMVFHGVPGGKEITAFASAILTAGAAARALDKFTLKDIAKIKKPCICRSAYPWPAPIAASWWPRPSASPGKMNWSPPT